MLDCGLDLQLQHQGFDALEVACSRGHLGIVRLLVDAGVYPDSNPVKKLIVDTPMARAMRHGSRLVVDVLLLLVVKKLEWEEARCMKEPTKGKSFP